MDTATDLPEGTHVNAHAAEIKLNAEIDASIVDGMNPEQISDYLGRLDMAEPSTLVDEMRAKLLAARA